MGERLEHVKRDRPERIAPARRPAEREPMAALRASRNSLTPDGPRKLGEVALENGAVEVGYDDVRRRLHLAFLRGEEDRDVVVSSASSRRVSGGAYDSNDGRFRRGAVDLRGDPDEGPDALLRGAAAAPCPAVRATAPFLARSRDLCAQAFQKAVRETVEGAARLRPSSDGLLELVRRRQGEEVVRAVPEEVVPERPEQAESQNSKE